MKKLIFSVTKKDFDITFFSGSGAGGQHRNRHKNCVRIKHAASGVTTTGTEQRSLEQNKKAAFKKMTSNPAFKSWLKMKTAEGYLSQSQLEQKVEDAMKEENLLIETFSDET